MKIIFFPSPMIFWLWVKCSSLHCRYTSWNMSNILFSVDFIACFVTHNGMNLPCSSFYIVYTSLFLLMPWWSVFVRQYCDIYSSKSLVIICTILHWIDIKSLSQLQKWFFIWLLLIGCNCKNSLILFKLIFISECKS